MTTFISGTDGYCENCKKMIYSPNKYYLYKFPTGVGAIICSEECGKDYSNKMEQLPYIKKQGKMI